jgi:hypothetical protein
MLRQINKFLWVCGYYGYRAKVFTQGINDRNEISVSEFFDKLNITSDNLLSGYFDFHRSQSFTQFLRQRNNLKTLSLPTIFTLMEKVIALLLIAICRTDSTFSTLAF